MPPQLEKNHVVPTAWQDEALARDGVSRDNSRKLCPLSDHITKQTISEEVLLRDIFTLKGAKTGLDLLIAQLEAFIPSLVISSLTGSNW